MIMIMMMLVKILVKKKTIKLTFSVYKKLFLFFSYKKNKNQSIKQLLTNKQNKVTKKARERYQNCSEDKKKKKVQCGCKQDGNLPENEKQRLVECSNTFYIFF